MIRLLIVDDHPVFRDGLATLIDTIDNVTVVAQADSADQAMQQARAHHPDVVLMDLNLGGSSGIAATARITESLPDTAVLVLTMSEDDESIVGALRAGARGYLLKGASQEEIVRAIQTVASGGATFASAAVRHVLDQVKDQPRSERTEPFPDLTGRERDVLRLVGEGLRNHVIAQRLGISQKTVANYLSTIFVKLQVEDRAEAAIKAREAQMSSASRPVGSGRLLATVLFVDIVDSSGTAAALGDRPWRDLIELFRWAVREELRKSVGKEVRTRGDGFLATFDSPGRAVRCAMAICERTKTLNISTRAGLHIGEIEFLPSDITGIAVHIGARIAELAGPGEVWVSRTVADLVAGSGLTFDDRGEHGLEGVAGSWQLFRARI